MLYVGHGAVISGAGPAIMQLAEKLQAPIVNTLLGKGAFAEDHPAAPGHAGHARHRLRQQGGDRLRPASWRSARAGTTASPASCREFCIGATKIHIDIDRAEFNKIVRPDVSIAGDARLVVEELLPLVDQLDTGDWLKQIADWRKQFPLKYTEAGRPQGAARARPAGRAWADATAS